MPGRSRDRAARSLIQELDQLDYRLKRLSDDLDRLERYIDRIEQRVRGLELVEESRGV